MLFNCFTFVEPLSVVDRRCLLVDGFGLAAIGRVGAFDPSDVRGV